jgi:hypothetical protein
MKYNTGHCYSVVIGEDLERQAVFHSERSDDSQVFMSLDGSFFNIRAPEGMNGKEIQFRKVSGLVIGVRYAFPDGREMVCTKKGWLNDKWKLEGFYTEDAIPVGIMWNPEKPKPSEMEYEARRKTNARRDS